MIYIYMIFLENEILLSKKIYTHWMEIQTEYYESFKTNFAAMTYEEIVDYFTCDYGENDSRWPFSKKKLKDFILGTELVISCIENSQFCE